uniref:Uncharacterized protein n=1 Tax=Cacopsylla melanoneura TaxID=428564 RepID=A0A8D8PYZ3_9HEMI
MGKYYSLELFHEMELLQFFFYQQCVVMFQQRITQVRAQNFSNFIFIPYHTEYSILYPCPYCLFCYMLLLFLVFLYPNSILDLIIMFLFFLLFSTLLNNKTP